jgi:hypothetical protein
VVPQRVEVGLEVGRGHPGRASARGAWLAALLLALGACATRETPPPAPPALPAQVQAGALIELARFDTGAEAFKAVIDADGQAHVLVATNRGRVLEVVVRDDSVVTQRPIPTQVAAPSSIDAAFDEKHRLHALVDDEHWVFDGQTWQRGSPPPWQVFGVPAQAPRFVPGAKHLIWSFNVDGTAIGAPGRIDWYGIGNAMGAIIWPWFSRGTRAVLVAQTANGFGPWVVFEPEGLSDTGLIAAAAEEEGKVHAVYRYSRPGLAAAGSIGSSYLTLPAERLSGADWPAVDSSGPAGASRLRIVSAQGGHWLDSPPQSELYPWVCVEPSTGTALVGANWLVRHLLWSGPLAWPHKADAFVAGPGGRETFHAVFLGKAFDPWFGKGGRPVRYLLLAEGRWSTPVDLGVAEVDSIWGSSRIDIATSGDVAYAVWPMPGGIVARRVVRTRP